MSDRAQELAEAMEAARLRASPHLYIRPFPTSLRPYKPPSKPPVRTPESVSRDIVADPNLGEPSSEALTEAPEVVGYLPTGQITSDVWQALLDIRVWRGRWWWRLAASLVVKRLRS